MGRPSLQRNSCLLANRFCSIRLTITQHWPWHTLTEFWGFGSTYIVFGVQIGKNPTVILCDFWIPNFFILVTLPVSVANSAEFPGSLLQGILGYRRLQRIGAVHTPSWLKGGRIWIGGFICIPGILVNWDKPSRGVIMWLPAKGADPEVTHSPSL